MVKEDAPDLFRAFLARESWRGQPIAMSGVTDCYQPAERRLSADPGLPGGRRRVPGSR